MSYKQEYARPDWSDKPDTWVVHCDDLRKRIGAIHMVMGAPPFVMFKMPSGETWKITNELYNDKEALNLYLDKEYPLEG